MNKYLLLILAFLILTIFAFEPKNSGIVGIGTTHFDNGEISFDYPSEWNKTNGTGSNVVSFSDSNGLNVKVLKLGLPPGYDLAARLQADTAGTINKSFELVSRKTFDVNGTTAYELNFNVNGANGSKQRKEIWIKKNNVLYGIILTAPSGMNVNSIDLVVNSLKINDSNANPKYRGWAQIEMPQFNQKWIFSSWSLNDAGAVRHLTDFYPGDKGQMVLLGHHTTHHAPFLRIKELKSGNKIIINNYLTQKKYIYVVTGNEIRMGVEAEDIKYQVTEVPELWLITCWPPGYSRGAFIVHCKLESVQPLD